MLQNYYGHLKALLLFLLRGDILKNTGIAYKYSPTIWNKIT